MRISKMGVDGHFEMKESSLEILKQKLSSALGARTRPQSGEQKIFTHEELFLCSVNNA
jgi:hypothetical protein